LNLRLGTVKGIKIQVHFTFLFIIIWGAFQYGGREWSGLLYGASLTLLLFGIVLLHELGHSLAALHFGIPVRDITLLPIGGLARLERMPDKPLQEFVVAVAGPAVNVVLAVLFLPLLVLFAGEQLTLTALINRPWIIMRIMSEPSLLSVLLFLSTSNLGLLIFNMIPAFPLDGGRIFRSLLAMFIRYDLATRIAVWIGRLFAILLGFYGLMSGSFFTAIIAIFIFSAGAAEGRAVAIRSTLQRIRVRQALSRVGTILQPNVTMLDVAPLTLYSHQNSFPVMLGGALIGVIRRHDIRLALERGKSHATVAEIMDDDVPRIEIDAGLDEAQEQLLQSRNQVAAVYEGVHFMGLLSFEDIERAFQMLGRRRLGWQAA
jgi:Zn-dependent protease/predicted transcriptional regulator